MKTFEIPAIGSVVTLTTKYRESYIFSPNEWRLRTYADVQVLKPERWFKPTDFKISSDDPTQPFRVIGISHVSDIVNGNIAQLGSQNQVVQVEGSKPGIEYEVVIRDGDAVSCTCKGYSFRQRCRHLRMAVDIINEIT